MSADGGFHLIEATLDSIQSAMRASQITSRQLVQWYLDRIAAYDKQGPGLNSVQMVNPRALDEAEQLDAQFRMPLFEGGQSGDDFANAERPRQRHPQGAAQAVCSARGIFGIVEIAEDLPRPFEKEPAGVGRDDVPRSAQQKLHAQPRLEACDNPRYRWLRHPEFARDAREVAGLAGANEGGQFSEPVTHACGV